MQCTFGTAGPPDVGEDFVEYWKSLFQAEYNDINDITRRVLTVFQEPNRYLKTGCYSPDVISYFSATPYERNSCRRHGKFYLGINASILGDRLTVFAQHFLAQLKKLSKDFANLNGRVMLQPCYITPEASPYMRYFGRTFCGKASHGDMKLLPREWYPYYYLCGVEWANIISPLARKHLKDDCIKDPKNSNVYTEEISGGGLLLASTKQIIDYDVADAINLRNIVSAALYPGGRTLNLRNLYNLPQCSSFWSCLPRADWAIVPVLETDLQMLGHDLIFNFSK